MRSAWSPIAGKRRSGDQNHYRALDWREMSALVARLRQNQVMGARTFEFVILTATRLSEARKARWSEINFDKAIWSIPASRMKNRAPHEVPLSDRALAHLTELRAHRTNSQVGRTLKGANSYFGSTAVDPGSCDLEGL
jgi:integrase